MKEGLKNASSPLEFQTSLTLIEKTIDVYANEMTHFNLKPGRLNSAFNTMKKELQDIRAAVKSLDHIDEKTKIGGFKKSF